MVNKQYRKSSFETALRAATNRLNEAQEERADAQKSLAWLNAEIPALERTIAALQVQLNPQGVQLLAKEYPEDNPTRARPTKLIGVSEVLPQDLSGMGAIRNGETIAVTEEDTLPEPEGTPILPEE